MSDFSAVAWRELEYPKERPGHSSMAGSTAAASADGDHTVALGRLREIVSAVAKKAFAAGKERGRRQVLQEWQSAVDRALDENKRELADFINRQRKMLAEQESAILELAQAVAEHIVANHVRENPEVLLDILRQVSAQRSARWREIRVHPDYARLLSGMNHGDQSATDGTGVMVVPDSSLEPGDLIITTTEGRYDLRLASRLRLVFEQLQDEVARA